MKKIAPTLQMWVNDENKRAWGNTDPRLPRVRAELRALLRVARAASGIMWHDCHALARCSKCGRLDRALAHLDRTSGKKS
jgi:hypothetical protein